MDHHRKIILERHRSKRQQQGLVEFNLIIPAKIRDQFNDIAAQKEKELKQQFPDQDRRTLSRQARMQTLIEMMTHDHQQYLALQAQINELQAELEHSLPYYIKHNIVENEIPEPIQQLTNDPQLLKSKLAASELERLKTAERLMEAENQLMLAKAKIEAQSDLISRLEKMNHYQEDTIKHLQQRLEEYHLPSELV
ncbi:MAG: hypothetical protein KIT27_10525 [Legionellales bacterium]|nr:hypothetical protein [Legionellales bacterium]